MIITPEAGGELYGGTTHEPGEASQLVLRVRVENKASSRSVSPNCTYGTGHDSCDNACRYRLRRLDCEWVNTLEVGYFGENMAFDKIWCRDNMKEVENKLVDRKFNEGRLKASAKKGSWLVVAHIDQLHTNTCQHQHQHQHPWATQTLVPLFPQRPSVASRISSSGSSL